MSLFVQCIVNPKTSPDRKGIVRCLVLLQASLYMCAGCASAQDVEFQVEGLEVVSKSNSVRIVGEDIELPILNHWVDSDLVVVNIRSDGGFEQDFDKMRSSLKLDLQFCDAEGDSVLLGLPYLYRDGQNQFGIDVKQFTRQGSPEIVAEGQVYQVVLFQSWTRDRVSHYDKSRPVLFRTFDLKSGDKDVCIELQFRNKTSVRSIASVMVSAMSIVEVISSNVGE